MNLHFEHPDIFYSLFFSLAHITSWIILIWYGHKHSYQLMHWLLIIVTGYVFFTIGTHLQAFDVEDLSLLINEGVWPVSEGKSLVSGLLLAVPVMLLVKGFLGFDKGIFDPYAFAIPIGIAIQRFGCLAAGCCYGKATNLPWGVSYNFGDRIHYLQWENGILSNIQFTSIPIHPVQLYESVMCLGALALIIYIYKKGWKQNQLGYVFLLFYTIIRFTTEFFRAPEAHTIGFKSYMGLNTVQWIMLFSFILLLYVLTRPLRSQTQYKKVKRVKESLILKDYLWYFVLLALILATPNFYSKLERLLLGIIMIPLSTMVFWQFFKAITLPQPKMATVSFCVLCIFLMSQNSPIVEEKTGPAKYHEISIGGNSGSLDMTHYYTDCEGNKHKDYQFKENYYLIGAAYKYVNAYEDDKKLTLGIGGAYGKLTEQVENFNYSYDQDIYYVSPSVQYDLQKIGIGLGVLVGDISVFRSEARPYSVFTRYSVLPLVHFRYGDLDKFWTEFNYGYRFPGIAPANEYEILLGARGEHGNLVRFGTSAYHAIVIRPEFYINNKFGIEPYIGALGPLFSGSYTDRMGIQGGINLHYRIYQECK